jgi:hypothetical protein
MTCRYCNQEIYEVPQHTGPDMYVHSTTGFSHCNADWEIRGGHMATPMEESHV